MAPTLVTDYYVCISCGVIHDYKYIHEISMYENENNSNKHFISKSFHKRMNYLNKKLYWITDRSIIILLNKSLEELKIYNNYNIIPFNKYINNM